MRLSRSAPEPSSANDRGTGADGSPIDTSSAPGAPDGLWATLSVAGVAVAVVDPTGTIDWCNPAFADLAERTPDAMVGHDLAEALGVERSDRFRSSFIGALRSDTLFRRFEVDATDWAGTNRKLAISASPTSAWHENGRIIVVAENLTTERRGRRGNEAPLDAARRASEDALTGLPNRITFEAQLESSLRRAARKQLPIAVLCCDLDYFHIINERLGDAAGDQLLQLVGSRLSHTLRHNDLLGRFSGDEFIVVAEEVQDDEVAHLVARRLAAAISEPFVIAGVDVRIGMSVGFTLSLGHDDGPTLLTEAAEALRGAKRAGRGRSMSIREARDGLQVAGPTVIDWNELAQVDPEPEPAMHLDEAVDADAGSDAESDAGWDAGSDADERNR